MRRFPLLRTSRRRPLAAAMAAACLTFTGPALAGCGASVAGPRTTGTLTTSGAASTTSTGSGTGSGTVSSPTVTTDTVASVGTWSAMAPSPLPRPLMATGAWDGTELLVVAVGLTATGNEYAAVAAYSPSTDRWRTLAAPSILSTQGEPKAVWTGAGLFVWGGGFHHVYTPATNTWRALTSIGQGPQGGGFAQVWTGRSILTWGGGCCGDARSDGASYDPATNTWTALPTSPLQGRYTMSVWTGTELLIAGGNDADGKVFDDAAAYDPATRRWRTLARMPAARAGATWTWTGHEAVMTGGYGTYPVADHLYRDGVAYTPSTDSWRTLPTAEPGRAGHAAVWTGQQLLVWGGGTVTGTGQVPAAHGLAYSPATGAWTALPISPLRGRIDPLAVWTGRQLLVWGGADMNDGARYTP